jgi:DNA helicase-4
LNKYDIYHEHFALNEKGQAPKEYGEDYLPRVAWKRKWYQEQNKKYFETTSANFRKGDVFKGIKANLSKLNVQYSLRTKSELEELYDKFAYESVIGLTGSAIKHIRNQGRAASELSFDFKYPDVTYNIFYDTVVSILTRYEKGLQARTQIDFEDMLLQSAKFIEDNSFQSRYKLILVDEFQDISKARYRLLKAFLTQKPGAMLFAVGDDWQGIYRFAGADLDIFVNFNKHFGVTSEMQLTKTFRSNQGISELASRFVQKNPFQKKKQVSAAISKEDHVVELITHSKSKKKKDLLGQLIEELIAHDTTTKPSLLILGRYNFNLGPELNAIVRAYQNSVDIEFMTFHKSKGLEADYTILLDVNSEGMPFPSIKEDHPLLKIFTETTENFRHAEERRLFYVALTRAKKKVYVLCNEDCPSIFIDELIGNSANAKNIKQRHVA